MNRNLCLVSFTLICLLLVVMAQYGGRQEYLDGNQGQYGRPNNGAEQYGRPNDDEEPYGRVNDGGQQYGRPNSGAGYSARLNNDDNPVTPDEDYNTGSRGNLGRPNYGYNHRPNNREEQLSRPSWGEGFRQDGGGHGSHGGGFGQNNGENSRHNNNYNTGT